MNPLYASFVEYADFYKGMIMAKESESLQKIGIEACEVY